MITGEEACKTICEALKKKYPDGKIPTPEEIWVSWILTIMPSNYRMDLIRADHSQWNMIRELTDAS